MTRTDRPSPVRRTIDGFRDAHRAASLEWRQRIEVSPHPWSPRRA